LTVHQQMARDLDEMMAVANETPFVPKGGGKGEGRGRGARPVTAGPALRPRRPSPARPAADVDPGRFVIEAMRLWSNYLPRTRAAQTITAPRAATDNLDRPNVGDKVCACDRWGIATQDCCECGSGNFWLLCPLTNADNLLQFVRCGPNPRVAAASGPPFTPTEPEQSGGQPEPEAMSAPTAVGPSAPSSSVQYAAPDVPASSVRYTIPGSPGDSVQQDVSDTLAAM
jgi:hypothetical protein